MRKSKAQVSKGIIAPNFDAVATEMAMNKRVPFGLSVLTDTDYFKARMRIYCALSGQPICATQRFYD
ncbi:MAG: hypothetical protein U1E91_00800 [Moraxella sp.]